MKRVQSQRRVYDLEDAIKLLNHPKRDHRLKVRIP